MIYLLADWSVYICYHYGKKQRQRWWEKKVSFFLYIFSFFFRLFCFTNFCSIDISVNDVDICFWKKKKELRFFDFVGISYGCLCVWALCRKLFGILSFFSCVFLCVWIRFNRNRSEQSLFLLDIDAACV